MKYEIKVIGIVTNDEGMEMRFVRSDADEWLPDLVVNHKDKSVRKPPECYEPTHEIITGLDNSLDEYIERTTGIEFKKPTEWS